MIHRTRVPACLLFIPLLLLPSGCTPMGVDDGEAIDCFWEFSVTGDTELSGDNAAHTFAGELLPSSFSLSLTRLGDTAVSGLLQSVPGPSAGQTGQFDADLSIVSGTRVWSVGEDAEDTFATITVARNVTSEFQGTITGVCVTAIDGERVTRAFVLTFLSAHGIAGAADCAGE
ncbi:MAG: hypothetical protein O7D91_09445 [Planctomycetota bacterium]|nr:hypothetical protein [Planctomycetota bacterium]